MRPGLPPWPPGWGWIAGSCFASTLSRTCEIDPASTPVLSWNLRGEFINVEIPPNFVVGLAEPLPWAPAIVVLDFIFTPLSLDPIQFTVLPPPSPEIVDPCSLPAYVPGEEPYPVVSLGYSGGWDPYNCQPYVCAVLNGNVGPCGVVPSVERTWGMVKALYK